MTHVLAPGLQVWVGEPPVGYGLRKDGLLGKGVDGGWLVVVLDAQATINMTWKRWRFLQARVGIFAGHRNAKQVVRILKRYVRWQGMTQDVERRVPERPTCSRYRKQPRRVEAGPPKPVGRDCRGEVLNGMEGPSNPGGAGPEGEQQRMAYKVPACSAA